MTVVEPHEFRGGEIDAELARELGELREALAGHRFPTRQDDLIASCLGRSLPARLCRRLSTLSHTTVYTSVDEVLAVVAQGETADRE